MKTLIRTCSVSISAYNGIDSLYKIKNPKRHAVNNFLNPLDFDAGEVVHVYFRDTLAFLSLFLYLFIHLLESEIYPQKEKIYKNIPDTPIDKRYDLFFKSL